VTARFTAAGINGENTVAKPVDDISTASVDRRKFLKSAAAGAAGAAGAIVGGTGAA